MTTSIPKLHHFIPRAVLQRFTDETGKMFFFDKKSAVKGVVTARPQTLFCRKHLYTARDKNGGVDVKLERYYARLEGLASRVIKKIVTCARAGRKPCLTAEEREIWDAFFCNQWKRVPDFWQTVFDQERAEAELTKVIADFEADIRALTPEERNRFQDPQWRKRMKQNAMVEALTQPSPAVLAILKQKGVGIAVVRKPTKSFAIGSFPVVKLTRPGREHLADPTVEVWLPIAHDVAVTPAPISPKEELIYEIDDSMVRRINGASFKQSTIIAGKSANLIASLAHSR